MILYKYFIFVLFFLLFSCAQHPAPAINMSQNSPENIKDEKPNSDALKHFMDAQLYISQKQLSHGDNRTSRCVEA